MKPSLRRRIFTRIGRAFGIHPDVSGLIGGAMRLANPMQAAMPGENLPAASRVIASGLWNYSFFQFYPDFEGPFWVQRQYNPEDPAFIPRAGSLLSVNLTHRNWMGFRGIRSPFFAMVDPAGALSPVVGSYSIELALIRGDRLFLPSKGDLNVIQKLRDAAPAPETTYRIEDFEAVWVSAGSSDNPDLILSSIEYAARSRAATYLVISIRPFNCEGAAPIHSLHYQPAASGGAVVGVNGLADLMLLQRPEYVIFNDLIGGDAYHARRPDLTNANQEHDVHCRYGICTAAFLYPLSKKGSIGFISRTYEQELQSPEDAILIQKFLNRASVEGIRTPRQGKRRRKRKRQKIKSLETRQLFDPTYPFELKTGEPVSGIAKTIRNWKEQASHGAAFQCVRKSWNRAAEVYRQYVLSLHTGTEVTPGIYTYKLFWFRDAAYILSALYNWNYVDHARSVLDTYPRRMDKNGFFRSQDGEWDSNGQAIWTLVNFARTIGDTDFLARVYPAIRRGAEWIIKKRREGLVQKILPAGFSAEHLGPADYYYWDNLWSVAGLRDAASVAEQLNHTRDYRQLQTELTKYKNDLLIISAEDRERHGVLPAAPGRGLDAGMIGNVCLLYPLQLDLFAPEEVERTIHCIQSRFCKNDLFFQSMIHSGYNIYLSIQLAQCFFRMGDVSTARRIFKKVLKSRTQLWTYPEAIHPHTGGGVMGDGFHGWAFAEILLLLREFVLHVDENRDIHIFRGMSGKELVGPTRLEFGPFPVQGVSVHISGHLRHTSGTIDLKITTPQGMPGRLKRVYLHLPTDDGAGRTVRIENPSLKGARLGERRNQTFVLRNLEDRVRFRF